MSVGAPVTFFGVTPDLDVIQPSERTRWRGVVLPKGELAGLVGWARVEDALMLVEKWGGMSVYVVPQPAASHETSLVKVSYRAIGGYRAPPEYWLASRDTLEFVGPLPLVANIEIPRGACLLLPVSEDAARQLAEARVFVEGLSEPRRSLVLDVLIDPTRVVNDLAARSGQPAPAGASAPEVSRADNRHEQSAPAVDRARPRAPGNEESNPLAQNGRAPSPKPPSRFTPLKVIGLLFLGCIGLALGIGGVWFYRNTTAGTEDTGFGEAWRDLAAAVGQDPDLRSRAGPSKECAPTTVSALFRCPENVQFLVNVAAYIGSAKLDGDPFGTGAYGSQPRTPAPGELSKAIDALDSPTIRCLGASLPRTQGLGEKCVGNQAPTEDQIVGAIRRLTTDLKGTPKVASISTDADTAIIGLFAAVKSSSALADLVPYLPGKSLSGWTADEGDVWTRTQKKLDKRNNIMIGPIYTTVWLIGNLALIEADPSQFAALKLSSFPKATDGSPPSVRQPGLRYRDAVRYAMCRAQTYAVPTAPLGEQVSEVDCQIHLGRNHAWKAVADLNDLIAKVPSLTPATSQPMGTGNKR